MRPLQTAILASLSLVLACVTGRAPEPPAALPAPAAPAPPRALALRAIPFLPGTFVGQVAASELPRVSAAEGAVLVQVPFTRNVDVECTIVRQALDAGGSIESVMKRTRVGARLRDQWVDEVALSPETGVLSLVVRRDDRTRIKVAAYRDRWKSLVCVHEGPDDAPAFKGVVASLAASLRSFEEVPAAGVLRLCTLKIGDGSVGFERVEMVRGAGEAGEHGETIGRVTTWMAFRDGPNGVALMELNHAETATAGRIATLSTVRWFAGQPDLQAALGLEASGAYHALVTARRQRHDGPFRVTDAQSLPGSEAVRKRIKDELLPGLTRELRVEQFDPLASPEKATFKIFARGQKEGEVIVTEGPLVGRQIFDPEGFMTSSEMTLPTGDVLSSSCRAAGSPAP